MRVVIQELKILVFESEDVLHRRIELHCRQRLRLARKLELHLLFVIGIDVDIAERVDEVAGLEIRHLRHHERQKRIAGDVERYAEEHVSAALIKLARKLATRDVELKHRVAGHEGHLLELPHVPRIHDHAAAIGVLFQKLDGLRDLVNHAPVLGFPAAPLLSVHGTEIALRIRPFVPNADAVRLQIVDIGVALEEPEQFMDDGLDVDLFRRDERKTLRKVETHLVTEDALGPGASAVGFGGAVLLDGAKKIEVLFQCIKVLYLSEVFEKDLVCEW